MCGAVFLQSRTLVGTVLSEYSFQRCCFGNSSITKFVEVQTSKARLGGKISWPDRNIHQSYCKKKSFVLHGIQIQFTVVKETDEFPPYTEMERNF